MATINNSGIVLIGLEGFVEKSRDIFRSVFGNDLSFDPETPQEQFCGLIGAALAEEEDALNAAYQALNIYRSSGTQLDGHMAAVGNTRITSERTTVTVVLTGVPTTVVPAGSRARTNAGDIFRLQTNATIGAGGSVSAVFESEESGAVPVAAGELNRVLDVVTGWETVNNPDDGTPGRPEETDPVGVRRYFRELFRNAVTPIESVISRVSAVAGVIDVAGAENDLDVNQIINGSTLIPHSIAIVVEGGENQPIADAIQASKTGGTAMNGDIEVNVRNPAGFDQLIKFYRVDYVNALVDITIVVDETTFPGNGLAQIKQNIVDYMNANFLDDQGRFNTSGIRIGNTLYKHRLYTPMNAVPGHTITAYTLGVKGGASNVESISAILTQKVRFETTDDITITVSS